METPSGRFVSFCPYLDAQITFLRKAIELFENVSTDLSTHSGRSVIGWAPAAVWQVRKLNVLTPKLINVEELFKM